MSWQSCYGRLFNWHSFCVIFQNTLHCHRKWLLANWCRGFWESWASPFNLNRIRRGMIRFGCLWYVVHFKSIKKFFLPHFHTKREFTMSGYICVLFFVWFVDVNSTFNRPSIFGQIAQDYVYVGKRSWQPFSSCMGMHITGPALCSSRNRSWIRLRQGHNEHIWPTFVFSGQVQRLDETATINTCTVCEAQTNFGVPFHTPRPFIANFFALGKIETGKTWNAWKRNHMEHFLQNSTSQSVLFLTGILLYQPFLSIYSTI